VPTTPQLLTAWPDTDCSGRRLQSLVGDDLSCSRHPCRFPSYMTIGGRCSHRRRSEHAATLPRKPRARYCGENAAIGSPSMTKKTKRDARVRTRTTPPEGRGALTRLDEEGTTSSRTMGKVHVSAVRLDALHLLMGTRTTVVVGSLKPSTAGFVSSRLQPARRGKSQAKSRNVKKLRAFPPTREERSQALQPRSRKHARNTTVQAHQSSSRVPRP
jgi:hypothetical protein